jgi:hypothetical protein
MSRRLWLVPILVSITALPAEAAPVCKAPVYVWDLDLVRIERLEGAIDPNEIAASLGSKGRLRGSFHDPAKRGRTPRVDLVGSTDGIGVNALGEKGDR